MARGYPDYQNPVNQVAGRLVDFSGIQSAILGLATLDGMGRLAWFDRFQDGVSAWETLSTLGASLPVISSEIAEIPPTCLRLRTDGAVINSESFVRRSCMFVSPSTVGLELSVLYNQGNDLILVYIFTVLSGNQANMGVLYRPSTGLIQLLHAGGATTFATLPAGVMARLWIPIKLVVDNVGGVGRRLTIGTQVWDLDGYVQNSGAMAECDQIYITISSVSQGAGSLDQYIGHVYLTLDEP
jgi:hypothetical protein